MINIVLDTNIFLAAVLSKKGVCRKILRYSINGTFQPLMGEALFHEYEDVLSRSHLFRKCTISTEEREELLNAFMTSCKWVHIYYTWRPNLRDEADNHLIELAVAGNAEVIVTRNIKDFNNAELFFESIKILKPENFIKDYKGILQ